MNKINDWVANQLSRILSHMYLFYLLFALDAIVIILSPPTNLQTALLDFSSIFLQSVALVIINNTTSRQGDRVERVLRETHDITMTEQSDIKEVVNDVRELVGQIHSKVHEQ